MAFTGEAAPVGVSLGGSPTPGREIPKALGNLLEGVGGAYSARKAAEAKAAQNLLTGQTLASFEQSAREITEGVTLGTDNNAIAEARQYLSAGEAAVTQASGRKSDIAAILIQARGRKLRTDALLRGDLATAEKIEQSFANYSAVDQLGGVVPDIMERGEISTEKFREAVSNQINKEMQEAGLFSSYLQADPATQARMYSVLEEQKRATNALKMTVDQINAQSAKLQLTKAQQEAYNTSTIPPKLDGARGAGISLVEQAIEQAKSIPLQGSDPELVAATVRQFRQRFNDIRSTLVGAKVPGVESIAEASIQALNKMEQDAVDALTNADAAKMIDQLYSSTTKKDTLAVPDEVRRLKEYLPIVNSLSNLEASGLPVAPEAKNQILSTSGYMTDVLRRGTPGGVNFGAMSPTEQKTGMKAVSTTVKNLLGKYDAPENKGSVDAAIAYVVGSSNQFQLGGSQTPHWYGDFLVDLVSNKSVYDELSKNTLMSTPRNTQFLLSAVQTYKEQLVTSINADMEATASSAVSTRAANFGLPTNSISGKKSDLVTVVTTKDGIVFTPSISNPKDPKYTLAKTTAAELQSRYGIRYRQTEQALTNLVGVSRADVNSAMDDAAAEDVQTTVTNSISDEDTELLNLIKKLSPEDRAILKSGL